MPFQDVEGSVGNTLARHALSDQRLELWPGTWTVSTTFADGSVDHGTFSVRRALGGHTLIGEYETTKEDRSFEGHWIQSRDPETGHWRTWWFDERLPGQAETAEIQEVPGALILTGDRRPGQPVRITEKWHGSNEVTHVIERDHGDDWVAEMTITYRRSGS